MFQYTSLFILYVFGFLAESIEGKIQVKIINTTGIPNPDHLEMTVNLIKSANGEVVDVDSNLKADIGSALFLWIDLQTKTEVSGYETLFKSENLDLCILLDSAKEHPLAIPFLENVNKHGNIPQTCPISKGHYYLKGFHINGETLPSFCPSGNFRLNFGVTYLSQNNITEKLFEMKWDVEIINDSQIGTGMEIPGSSS